MIKGFNKYLLLGLVGILVVGFFVGSARHVQAEEKSDDNQGVDTVVLEGPVIKVGQELVVDQYVKGDLIIMARKVQITGVVEGNVYGMAETVELDGQVDGNIHLLARNIDYAGEVQGSSYSLSQYFTSQLDSVIGGSVIAAGESLDIQGKVKSIFLAGSRLLLGGQVDQANLRVDSLKIIDNAKVGKVQGQYKESEISESSNITDNQLKMVEQEPKAKNAAKRIFMRSVAILGWAIGFALLFMFVKYYLVSIYQALDSRSGDPLKSLGVGFLASIASPFVLLVGTMPFIGWSFIGLAITVWILALTLTPVIVIQTIANKFADRNLQMWEILGIALLVSLAYSLPLIGLLVKYFGVIISLGLILRTVVSKTNKKLNKNRLA